MTSATAARPALTRRIARSRWLPEVALATVIAVLSWPVSGLSPLIGLDGSWMVGLSMATHEGLDFGRDVVFTYGPLGFMKEPVAVYPWPVRLAFAYEVLIALLVCLALVRVLREGLGSLLAAAGAALLLALLITDYEPVLTLVFIGAVAVVSDRVPERALRWAIAPAGVLAAVEVLARMNIGITVLLLAVIAIATAPRNRRDLAIRFAAGLAGGLAFAWLATGQSVAAIPEYLSGARQIISGYSEAMGLPSEGHEWEYPVAVALALLGAVGAYAAGARGGSRARAGLVALWVVLAFTAFKGGFVRHANGHGVLFFAVLLGGFAALAWSVRVRTIALVGALAVAAVLGSRDAAVTAGFDAHDRAGAFFSQLATLTDGSRTNEEIGDHKASTAAVYPVDSGTLAAIGRHAVHIDPWDIAVARAYTLNWHPLPVFQSYAAYAPELDRRNARELEDPAGPQRILRALPQAIDGRNPSWESPEAVRAMLCNFRAIQATDRWVVLARSAPRCAAPRLIGRTEAGWGEPMAAPAAATDEAVIAEVDGLQVEGLERIRTLVHRSEVRWADLNGGRTYRLVHRTVENGLLMRVPRPADFPAPFALGLDVTRVAFRRGEGDQPDGRVSVRWLAMRVRSADTIAP